MNIVYASDSNYAPVLGVSLCSLFENNRKVKKIDVYILDNKIKREEKDKLKHLAGEYDRDLIFVPADTLIEYYERNRMEKYNGNFSAYIKLAVGELLNFLDKCLYIDCDTMILDDLEELYDTELKEKPVGAVIDSIHSCANIALSRKKEDPYYNTGVLLVNLKLWREERLLEKLVCSAGEIELKRTATNSEQELINYLLGDKILPLPLRYNVITFYRIRANQKIAFMMEKDQRSFYLKEEIKKAAENPAIIHFTGFSWGRPWVGNSVDPRKAEWEYYLTKTPWKNMVRTYEKQTLWRKMCIMAERHLPVLLFCLVKRYEERFKLWKKRCAV